MHSVSALTTLYLVFLMFVRNRVRETLRFATSIQPMAGLVCASQRDTSARVASIHARSDESPVAIASPTKDATATSPNVFRVLADIDPSQPNGYRVDRSAPGNLSDPKNRAWNNNRRENKVRNLLLTCSWRFLRNLHVSKVDMANYQPFFLHNDFERYGINLGQILNSIFPKKLQS